MKKCSKCKETKDLSQFNKRHLSKDKLNYQCRDCEKIYTRNHYKHNKDYYKLKAKRNNKSIKQWFVEYRSKLKCEICEEAHPATFDFHHIDPSKKEECISILVAGGSLKKLQEELKKCKVFCANCHRKFHFKDPVVQLD